MSNDLPAIMPARPQDLDAIVRLAKGETDTIGFLPRRAYEEYITGWPHAAAKGVLLAVTFRTISEYEIVGFIVWRVSGRKSGGRARQRKHIGWTRDLRSQAHVKSATPRLPRPSPRRQHVEGQYGKRQSDQGASDPCPGVGHLNQHTGSEVA